ncbi:alpha-L-rhamnosidase [Schaalia sp. ZJ1691]|uniref:alpha-L-rhamnosidase n=1 Tax=Schaalia sp. ZJ1691 TaxID=2709404 RepID=UPI0013ED43D1|nr:alpha-L-rhamnosidase [Schaalia sp. ZJ1691]
MRARLYVTGYGVFTPRINAQPVDDSVLNPGWTSYAHRLQFRAWDVSHLIQPGNNTIDATIADGWFRGTVGFLGTTELYGDRLALLAQLEVEYADGQLQIISTDETWKARDSRVEEADLYNGQRTNLTENRSKRIDTVEVLHGDLSTLTLQQAAPIRPTGVLSCQKVWRSPRGSLLADFGQNAVGWIRLRSRGLPENTCVRVRHAEELENGELATRPLRSARATDEWILGEKDEYILQPEFTLHGFRYVEIQGIEILDPQDIEFVIVGTDLQRRGWFECSHELLNKLHSNVVWSMRSNFVSIPTDCPQRDERLGWTGDIQIFVPTAVFLYDTTAFLHSWLADVRSEQYVSGAIPHVVPTFIPESEPDPAAAAWGDAATIVPWTLYEATGDVEILREQISSMRQWVDHITELAGPELIWSGGFQYGDWLDPSAPPEAPALGKTDPDVVATAYFARSASIVADACEVLGDRDGAQKYAKLAERIRRAFNRRFVTPEGYVHSDSQCAYAMALEWNLLEGEHQRRWAGKRLADLVRVNNFRIDTGFVGTPLICDALTHSDEVETAMRLMLQQECPSWLYPVTMGATTVWERWDSMLPDGSVNPGEMTSFNHYAFGAIADWMHRTIGGISMIEPGWKRVRIAPHTLLESAKTALDTPYGMLEVQWENLDDRFAMTITIPVGVTADVLLPSGRKFYCRHGKTSFEEMNANPTRDHREKCVTVRDVLDDRNTWKKIIEILYSEASPEYTLTLDSLSEEQLVQKLSNYLSSPAHVIAEVLVPFPTCAPQGQRQRILNVIDTRD